MNAPKTEPEAAKVVETETAKVVQVKLPDAARIKRRNVVLSFLAVVGLLVVLTFNFSRRPVGEMAEAPRPMALPPISVEQLEALSRQREDVARRLDGQPARFSDEGPYLSPEERGREEEELGREEEGGAYEPGFDEPTPPLYRPEPPQGPRAIDAPLVPADSGAGASGRSVDTEVGRDSGELAVLEGLRQSMAATLPTLAGVPMTGASGRSAGRDAGRDSGELGVLERLPAPPQAMPPAVPQPPSTQLFSSSSSVARRTSLNNRLLAAGTAIPLVLAHRVVTDVPGPVVGITIRPVYDTLTSSRLVLPRGARCFGEIHGQPGFGDHRVTVSWSSCQANGVRLELGPQGSAALDGSAGIPAHVNQHWGQRLGTALALSFISAGVQLAQPERRDSAFGLTPGQILAGQVGTDLGRVTTQILERGFARPPTLTLEAGTAVQLLILRDLEIP